MAYDSKISWTDGTWNPFRGCSRIATGCVRCYAERMAARNLPGHRSPTTGKPFAIMTENGPRWTGEVELMESQLDIPLHWQKPRKIFVNSMSDTFHAMVPSEWLDRMFAVMALCPQHTFIIPTKRIGLARQYLSDQQLFQRIHEQIKARMGYDNPKRPAVNPGDLPLPNVILLASIANQTDADRDIPILLDTPAAVRGISLEPMIGPVCLSRYLHKCECGHGKIPGAENTICSSHDERGICKFTDCVCSHFSPALGWVIVGGESGPGARPCNIEWIRDIVRQCRAAKVPCFVKQLGARSVLDLCADPLNGWPHHVEVQRQAEAPYGVVFKLRDRAGADPAEWPAGDWPQEWPEMRRTDGR